MRKALKVRALIISILILLTAAGAVYVKSFLPSVSNASQMHIVSNPQKIQRGKYLATRVMVCMDCHSTRDWNFFGGPRLDTVIGRGGELFDRNAGLPGSIYAANITSAGIGNWTDGEQFQAITTGVRKNGKPIFSIMPYDKYELLNQEDIEAVICYIRSLPSVDNKVLASEYDFPMSYIVNTIPKRASLNTILYLRPKSTEA